MEQTQPRRKRKRIPVGQIILILLLIPAIYLARLIYRATNVTYAYETAITATMSDSIRAQGLVLFDETPVEGSGDLGYLVQDGEKVSAGVRLAERYTDPSQASVRTQLDALEAELDLLEKSQNTSSTQVDVLVNQRNTAIYALLENIETGQTGQLQALREDYLLAQNKLQITTGAENDFSARIAELTDEQASLSQQLTGLDGIDAPAGGYFVSSQNAHFLNISKDDALALSAADLQTLLENGAETTPEGVIGKLVAHYTWTFCGVCTAEQAEKFAGRRTVQISFPGKAETAREATVVSVETDSESGLAKFVLSCTYLDADILQLGQENAQIDFETYTGLRVSADAIHLVREDQLLSSRSSATSTSSSAAASASASQAGADAAAASAASADSTAASAAAGEEAANSEYVTGVFVKYGNIARFRRAEILYESPDSGYVLIAPGGSVGTDNEVRLYDEVIISGMELYDGKLL